jgi:hypothetical protein
MSVLLPRNITDTRMCGSFVGYVFSMGKSWVQSPALLKEKKRKENIYDH